MVYATYLKPKSTSLCTVNRYLLLDDFESAENKLKKAELTSNLDTTDEEDSCLPLKRKRKLRRFSSSCNSENENSPTKPRPPALKLKVNAKVNKGQFYFTTLSKK